jgi:hypothetical protein
VARSFELTGADDFLKLSKALKAAGEKDLRKELHKGMRDGARDVIPLAREEAREILPKRGGMNELVAKAPMRIRVSTGRDFGVSVVARKLGSGARGADFGRIRHPIPGTDKWASQDVPKGWLRGTTRRSRHLVIPKLEAAMERVARKVVSRLG